MGAIRVVAAFLLITSFALVFIATSLILYKHNLQIIHRKMLKHAHKASILKSGEDGKDAYEKFTPEEGYRIPAILQKGKTRAQTLRVFLNICIPRLVCELNYASSEMYSPMNENLNRLRGLRYALPFLPTTESYDRFHFASSMGSLFYDADGAACQYLYSKCPLSRMQLQEASDFLMVT